MKRFTFIIVFCALAVGMVVGVNRAAAAMRVESAIRRCDTQSDATSQIQCWEDAVRGSLKTGGIEEAFKVVSGIYDRYPQFAKSCHEMVHIVGQGAYDRFMATGRVYLSERTAMCSFGFYHGFMEMLVSKKGAISDAQEFCDYVGRTIGANAPAATLGCFHGIGHGATDAHNPAYYGNERALVASAIPTCEAFARNAEELKLCATGIFDSISLAYYNGGENGLVIKKDDPLWLCREQPEKYKEACYLDLMPAVIWMGEHDLTKSTHIVLKHAEEQYKILALKTLADNSVRFIMGQKPATVYVPHCRSLGGRFTLACIAGLGTGVMQFGPPGREYEGALAFCRDPMLASGERDACLTDVLSYVRQRYGRDQVAAICRRLEAPYRSRCL